MAAADRVLQLCELLEAILLQLPPTEITKAMRVSKGWCDLITSSTRLHNARILTATSVSISDIHCGMAVPQYVSSEVIKINPLFSGVAAEIIGKFAAREADYLYMFTAFEDLADWDGLSSMGQQFVTHPPCQRLMLACRDLAFGEYHFEVCVKSGIRIMDLAEIAKAVRRSHGECGAGMDGGPVPQRSSLALRQLEDVEIGLVQERL